MVNTIYLFSFVETPHKFIIAELSIRNLKGILNVIGYLNIYVLWCKAWDLVHFEICAPLSENEETSKK